MAKAVKTHTVKDGDTLDKIAKKYGFKNPKDIWSYKKNIPLVRERKKPENIRPKDKIILPLYNDKERKEIEELHEKYLRASLVEKYAAAQFAQHAKTNLKIAATIDKVAAEHLKAGNAYLRDYQASVNKAKQWSDMVDYANLVAGMVGSLVKIGIQGGKAGKVVLNELGEVCEKAYKQLVIDNAKFMAAPLISEVTKATGKTLANVQSSPLGDFVIFSGVAIESFGKWTSPSFYGQAVGLLAEGKSWTEASTFDIKRDCKETIARMKAEQAHVQKVAKAKAGAARKRAKLAEKASANAAKMHKEYYKKAHSAD